MTNNSNFLHSKGNIKMEGNVMNISNHENLRYLQNIVRIICNRCTMYIGRNLDN